MNSCLEQRGQASCVSRYCCTPLLSFTTSSQTALGIWKILWKRLQLIFLLESCHQAFIRLNYILFKLLPLDKMLDDKAWLTKLTHVLRKLSMSITVLLSFNGKRISQFWATETYSVILEEESSCLSYRLPFLIM